MVLRRHAPLPRPSDVQNKAQAELTVVIGPNHLPRDEDEQSLPYICALAKESLQWRSVASLGLGLPQAHRVIEGGKYRGCRIPKGPMVIASLW